jgi:hypothetical protein
MSETYIQEFKAWRSSRREWVALTKAIRGGGDAADASMGRCVATDAQDSTGEAGGPGVRRRGDRAADGRGETRQGQEEREAVGAILRAGCAQGGKGRRNAAGAILRGQTWNVGLTMVAERRKYPAVVDH